MKHRTQVSLSALLLSSTLLAACGGGGGSAGTPPGTGSADLTAALGGLGIDTSQTPRLGEDGSDLEDYSPLGASWDMARPAEVVLAGIQQDANSVHMFWHDDAGSADLDALQGIATTPVAWVAEELPYVHEYKTKRAFAVGDLDADGRDETVGLRAVGSVLTVRVWEDAAAIPSGSGKDGPPWIDHVLGDFGNVTSVALAVADLDGDARDELMVGYTNGAGAVVEVYDETPAGYALLEGSTRLLTPTNFASAWSLVLAAGNHDQDDGFESVAVLNEYVEFGSTTRFTLWDDARDGFAVLASGEVLAGATPAVVADATFGDVDGDGLDELVLGGLSTTDGGACVAAQYVGVAYEDLAHGGGVLGATTFSSPWTECDSLGYVLEFAHVLALDWDGDHVDEVVLNRHVLELDPAGGAIWREKVDDLGVPERLPEDAFFSDQTTGPFTRSTSTMAAGDVRVLGREQVLVYFEDYHAGVRVFGEGPDLDGDLVLQDYGAIPTSVGIDDPGTATYPTVLLPDMDDDGVTLVREDVEHQVVFTEPIVLAVLAAPPTVGGIQQNYADSATTFGNTTYSGETKDSTLTLKASASIGVKVNGGAITQSGFEMKGTVSAAASVAMGTTYTLSESVHFTTGMLEDSVVFTCIPMDRYVYRVVKHHDDEMVDAVVTVDLPRKPVTLQVERAFYNQNIAEGSPVIDSKVLQHTIGDVDSYPTKAVKTQTVLQHHGLTSSGVVNVGAGSGSSGITLELEESSSFKEAMELGYSFEMETTAATITAGFSVGSSAGASFQTSDGSATTWSGTVGDIAPVDFAANSYSYGLFTYYYSDPQSGQKFQVVNYWVE